MKSWILFFAAWCAIAILQASLGYKCTGYSAIFTKREISMQIGEVIIAIFCLTFFSLCRCVEMWRCRRLLKEYGEFVKSVTNKNNAVKQVLFQMKISLFLILVGVGFSIFAGMLNHFNWIVLIMLCCLKMYYVTKFKRLINMTQKADDILPQKN